MVALKAQIRTDDLSTEGRRSVRRTLQLDVDLGFTRDAAVATIHNLSETGLLIETAAELRVGEPLAVDLPQIGAASARIVWTRGRFFGCQFDDRVPKAAVSAALLRSPAETPLETPHSPEAWIDWVPHVEPSLDVPTRQTAVLISLAVALAVVILLLLAIASI